MLEKQERIVAAKNEPTTIERHSKALVCTFCENDTFWLKEGLLSSRMANMLGTGTLRPSGNAYICSECRHITWFWGKYDPV